MLVIDCNNLWYAAVEQRHEHPLAGISRADLATALDDFARWLGRPMTVVLDGPEPGYESRPASASTRIYSRSRSADAVIEQLVADSTEPRRLTVVTSDRALARQVRRRRVKVLDSEAFAARLADWLERPRPRRAAEPAAKSGGLGGTDDEIDRWVRYFQLDRDPEQHDIMEGERAGDEGIRRSQPDERPAVADPLSPSPPTVDPHPRRSLDAEIGRAFRDISPLKKRNSRRTRAGKELSHDRRNDDADDQQT
ncbi:MAG: hypothetical protein BIFFINMI_01452 [Phycisphaerae bacterium]|nr:hypothetical protein [Phycisphaerae bacterium]